MNWQFHLWHWRKGLAAGWKALLGVLGLALVLAFLTWGVVGLGGRSEEALGTKGPAPPRAAAPDAELERLQAAARKNPGSAEARVRLANAYLARNRLREAMEESQRALEQDPHHAEAWRNLTALAAALGQPAEALVLARRAVKRRPKDPGLLNNLAVLLEEAGQREEARKTFQQALALAPNDPLTLSNYARYWDASGNGDQAEAYARRALKADPQALDPWLLLSDLDLRRGRLEAALAQLQQLADQHPRSAAVCQALVRTGDVCRQKQDPATALKCYAQALRLVPDFLDARLGQAQALRQQGQPKAAIRAYEALLRDAPEHPVVRNNLAYLYAETGEHLDRALDLATRLVTAVPDNASGRDTLGWVLYRQGRYREALKPLGEAVQREPQKGIFHYHRGQTLRALQRHQEAVEALRKALALGLPPREKKAAEAALDALRPGK